MLNTKIWWIAAVLMLVLVAGTQGSYIIGPTAHPITPSTGIPVFVQTAEAHQTAASDLSASFASLPTINNVVLVGIAVSGGGATGDLDGKVTDNQGNSYARLSIQSPNGGSVGVISLWCAVVTISSGTYTVTVASNAAAQKGIMILEYSATSCNPDKVDGINTGTSPYGCGSITTKNPKDLLLAFLLVVPGATGTVTFTAPAGFTVRQQFGTAASGLPMAIADQAVTVVNTYAPTFGASQNLASSQCSTTAIISQ